MRPSRASSASHAIASRTRSAGPAVTCAGASIQSARNRSVSPASATVGCRFDAKTSFEPSGENIGKPSKPPVYVMRSRFEPSVSTAHRSNSRPFGSPVFDEKMMRLPDGKKYGPNDAAPR